MFDVKPNEEQMLYTYRLVAHNNFGNRGSFDGTTDNQLVGILAQTILADLLGQERPKAEGFDGGVDLVVSGHSLDVKAMQRKVPVGNDFAHNLVASQLKYGCEAYIFTSWNVKNGFLTVCGAISKQLLLDRAKLYKKGDLRHRRDGTTFAIQADMYEIKQSDLIQANSLYELEEIIRNGSKKNV